VQFFVSRSHASSPARCRSTIASLRAFTRFMSTLTGPPTATP
jgi:hypothetical protein